MPTERDPIDEIDRIAQQQGEEVVEALYRSAEDLLGQATLLAPVEEGTLRGSGVVVMIVNGVRYQGAGVLAEAKQAVRDLLRTGLAVHVDAEVSFNTPYAARQHEELDWNHPLGGQAKYLEQPFAANVARYIEIVHLAAARPTIGA